MLKHIFDSQLIRIPKIQLIWLLLSPQHVIVTPGASSHLSVTVWLVTAGASREFLASAVINVPVVSLAPSLIANLATSASGTGTASFRTWRPEPKRSQTGPRSFRPPAWLKPLREDLRSWRTCWHRHGTLLMPAMPLLRLWPLWWAWSRISGTLWLEGDSDPTFLYLAWKTSWGC